MDHPTAVLTPPSSATGNGPSPSASRADDSWAPLRRFTSARIALGRAGGSMRTPTLLAFRLGHARARDSVLAPFRPSLLAEAIGGAGFEALTLTTAATDRRTYLVRPDLGRTLSAEARVALAEKRRDWGTRGLAIIVSDGLSPLAVERHAVPTLRALTGILHTAGWTLYPVLIAPFGRVKLQDEVGEVLAVRHTLMLLGERPGLGSPDSLGAYFTHAPRASCTDADRNCVSNIRPEGLAPEAAGRKLAQLLIESARLSVSGVALKDRTDTTPAIPATST